MFFGHATKVPIAPMSYGQARRKIIDCDYYSIIHFNWWYY